MSQLTSQASALQLDVLESDCTPTFVIKIGAEAIDFEILYCNEAFRKGGFRDALKTDERKTLQFRSWSQAVRDFKETYEFDNVTWKAEIAGRDGNWKIVRASDYMSKEPRGQDGGETAEGNAAITNRQTHHIDRRENFFNDLGVDTVPSVQDLPKTNLHARWETLQAIMEMSDVGVFEYTPAGVLIHGNNAWYKLSSHPREIPAHTDFSFIDLVYPDDRAIVMSAWNTLIQGKPVTFEMRWKGRPGSEDAAQWVLSSCLPVYEDGEIFSIAGNTIDINAQKKTQEAAIAQVKALELARKSERKFTRFAQLAPIAIYIFSEGSGMQYVNDQFFELTGQQRMAFERLDWDQIVSEEDIDEVEAGWRTVLQGKKTELQFRLKKTWVNQEGVLSKIWVQNSSYPELDRDGNVISIMGTLFDISQFKWAESVQRRMIEEALEAKRQQENFIDMTSHELRNPLSAVVQCADSVIATLNQLIPQKLDGVHESTEKVKEEVMTCIDSLQTIVSCSLHQKRVIDDVLTLSKLDSNLILITPMRVQPAVVVSDALKMFDVECTQMQITLKFEEDKTLKGLEWVMMDPSRLLQVLINLLTNAIKFTKDRALRKVTVTLGGATKRPPPVWHGVTFTNYEDRETSLLDKPEWGNGAKAFIWLRVDDTGCGMTDEEQKKLFSRFTQATPRTHVKYGGSGLGLFISKSLASLQGGSIGVNSTPEVGSTFAFFICTRIAQPPIDTESGQTLRPHLARTISTEQAMKNARLRILIVEDNVVNQKVLSKQLQKVGCSVHVAGNGVEALEWLKASVHWRGERPEELSNNSKQPPDIDIILMDIEMPVMDGLTCTRLIRDYEHQGLLVTHTPNPRSLPQRKTSTSSSSQTSSLHDIYISTGSADKFSTMGRLPILAVSANARNEQISQAIAAGVDDAIAKPFRIPELWPKMEALVTRRHNGKVRG